MFELKINQLLHISVYKGMIVSLFIKLIPLIILFQIFVIPHNTFAQVCSGNIGNPIFTETFGTGFRADLNTTSSGTTTYCYEDGTGSDCVSDTNSYMTDNEATLYSGNPQDLNIYWVTGGDHTGDSNGMMAVFNADFEPNEFYRLEVNNLCGGIVFEFAAWIANLYDPMNTPGPCFENNGDGLYPNVTFEIRNSFTDELIASTSTGNILPTIEQGMPDNIQWNQFGLIFEMPVGLNSINIVMRNNGEGGCGNDLAIDDITLRVCGPVSSVNQEVRNPCIDTGIVFTALVGAGFTDPYFKWEIRNINQNSWLPLNFSGSESLGFGSIKLFDIKNGDSIRFKVAGDVNSINNENCFSISDVLVVDGVIDFIIPSTDIINFNITQANENTLCLDNYLELNSDIDNIVFCSNLNTITFDYESHDGKLCFSFYHPDIESEMEELCVIVCDDYECIVCDTTYVRIKFKAIEDTGQCLLSNVITPNGDNVNDVLHFKCVEGLDDIILKVYNRWGNQVYGSNNYKNNWDGTYKERPLPDGIYFYLLEYFKNNSWKKYTSFLTIIR